MGNVIKIGLGIFLGGILLVVGCSALFAAGTNFEDTGRDTALEDAVDGGDEPKRSPQKTRRFAGNGSKNVGTIKVTDDAVLAWKHSPKGEPILGFSANDDDYKITVSSQAKKGQTALEPGTYRNVNVTADEDWSMVIKGR